CPKLRLLTTRYPMHPAAAGAGDGPARFKTPILKAPFTSQRAGLSSSPAAGPRLFDAMRWCAAARRVRRGGEHTF
ncbi:MAG: hypothetical protein ACYC26_09265, partial [Phycisphaerales bacterium]